MVQGDKKPLRGTADSGGLIWKVVDQARLVYLLWHRRVSFERVGYMSASLASQLEHRAKLGRVLVSGDVDKNQRGDGGS